MTTLDFIRKKIVDRKELEHLANIWRFKDQKIVFTNGCFDILHLGHIDYLSKAADLGDILVIGVNTDESVSRLKGPNRPINGQEQRSIVLASLGFVDAVILFGEETPFELISLLKPDILVKGSDYQESNIVGADVVKNRGGQVKTIDFLAGFSTSLIEEKILRSRK